MKKIGIWIICLSLICMAFAGCNNDNSGKDSNENDTSSVQKLTAEEYQSIASIFGAQYESLMAQLQAMLTSYAGNDDWYNGFNALYNQAKNAEIEFTANKDKLPDECVEEYNTLMGVVNTYDSAMNKVQEAHSASGNDQQQKLNEAAQILMQANAQWIQTQSDQTE